MNYEINVALNGKHFFATAERSITSELRCKEVYDKLVKAFPESEGYKLSVIKWRQLGESVDMDKLSPQIN